MIKRLEFHVKQVLPEELVNSRQYLCLYGDDWLLLYYDGITKELCLGRQVSFTPDTIMVFELPDLSD